MNLKNASDGYISSMVCFINYSNSEGKENFIGLIIAHVIICLSMLLIAAVAIWFSKKRQDFLIRERAPNLALLQLVCFEMTLLIPYVVELALWYKDTWEADEIGEIPWTRRFAKGFYSSSKVVCYFCFLGRVLVIYGIWRVDRKDRKAFWRVMGNEKRCLIVRTINHRSLWHFG